MHNDSYNYGSEPVEIALVRDVARASGRVGGADLAVVRDGRIAPLAMRGVPDVSGNADPDTGYNVRVGGSANERRAEMPLTWPRCWKRFAGMCRLPPTTIRPFCWWTTTLKLWN